MHTSQPICVHMAPATCALSHFLPNHTMILMNPCTPDQCLIYPSWPVWHLSNTIAFLCTLSNPCSISCTPSHTLLHLTHGALLSLVHPPQPSLHFSSPLTLSCTLSWLSLRPSLTHTCPPYTTLCLLPAFLYPPPSSSSHLTAWRSRTCNFLLASPLILVVGKGLEVATSNDFDSVNGSIQDCGYLYYDCIMYIWELPS